DRGIEGLAKFGGDSSNSRVFVGGLDPTVTEEELRRLFEPHGTVINVKIVNSKWIGFVQYSTRASAECAIKTLNGVQLGCNAIRLAYAHRPTVKGPLLGGHYAHPQTYDNYAWAMEMFKRDELMRQKQFEAQMAHEIKKCSVNIDGLFAYSRKKHLALPGQKLHGPSPHLSK
ncbi:unnamed protein product, partial [Urochloa humidicola]